MRIVRGGDVSGGGGGGGGEWCCLKFSLVSYSWDIVSEAALLE